GLTPAPSPTAFITHADSTGALQTYYAATVDDNGDFVFTGIPTGPFTLTVSSDLGIPATATGNVADPATPVTLNVSLPPTGTVTGTITDAAGNPLATGYALVSSVLGLTTFDNSDDSGHYSVLSPLAP